MLTRPAVETKCGGAVNVSECRQMIQKGEIQNLCINKGKYIRKKAKSFIWGKDTLKQIISKGETWTGAALVEVQLC